MISLSVKIHVISEALKKGFSVHDEMTLDENYQIALLRLFAAAVDLGMHIYIVAEPMKDAMFMNYSLPLKGKMVAKGPFKTQNGCFVYLDQDIDGGVYEIKGKPAK